MDYNVDLFNRDSLKKNLKRKSTQSAVNKISANGLSFILSILSTMVLARVLSPKDFGLLAMVTAVTEFARSFRELGLGTLTVQREKITQEEVSTLFWINLAGAIVITSLIVLIAPGLVWFYGESRIFSICIALSLVFLINGLAVQHRALLERQMKFGSLGLINVISNLAGFSFAIALALHGYGVWALVASELLSAGFYTIGTWLCYRWVPGPPNLRLDLKSMLRFGADVSAFDVFQYLSRNVDRLLIGRYWGAYSLGLYAKIYQIAMMPIEQIRIVFWDIGFSPLSALQSDADRFRTFYGKLVSIMALFYMPIVVLLIIKPESVILLLLGEKWLNGRLILRIIAIGGFFRPIIATFQLVMITCDKTRRYLKWGIISGIMMVISFGIGIRWGAIGVAIAYASSSYVILIWSLRYCLKDTPISSSMILRAIKVPLIASWGAGLLLALIVPSYESSSSLIFYLTRLLVVLFSCYLCFLLWHPESRAQVVELWSCRKELFVRD